MTTSNPALNKDIFRRTALEAISSNGTMTIGGTIGKTLALTGVMLWSAGYAWTQVANNPPGTGMPWVIAGFVIALIASMVAMFKPATSPIAAPIYAAAEGIVLGYISAMYNSQYQGLPMQAVALTAATLVGMLVLYRTGLIKPSARFYAILSTATMGIFVFYLISIAMSFFGTTMPGLYSNGPPRHLSKSSFLWGSGS